MRGFEEVHRFSKRHDQGEEAEEKVALALSKLKRIGLITHFVRAEKHSQLDVEGVDFLVFLDCGMAFLLQVKSSMSAVKRHYMRHPDIPCITVLPRQDRIRSLERRIIAIIRKRGIAYFKKIHPKFLK